MGHVKRIGFVVHPGREPAQYAADRLSGWLETRGVETRRFNEDEGDGSDAALYFAKDLDLVVSVGGDGTFLRAAHIAHMVDRPILGVKVGRLGFLTEVEPDHAPALLERFLQGTAVTEERLAVVAEPLGIASFEPQWALNEMMVEKRARHRIIRLAVYVDDVYVTTFSADGVIVATPTGSTAYSFSAGGPIVTPTIPCILVTPVAAHMVFDRSLVLSSDERVSLEVMGEEDGLLSADGRESLELPVGAAVRIGRAPVPARIVRPGDLPDVRAELRRGGDPFAGGQFASAKRPKCVGVSELACVADPVFQNREVRVAFEVTGIDAGQGRGGTRGECHAPATHRLREDGGEREARAGGHVLARQELDWPDEVLQVR